MKIIVVIVAGVVVLFMFNVFVKDNTLFGSKTLKETIGDEVATSVTDTEEPAVPREDSRFVPASKSTKTPSQPDVADEIISPSEREGAVYISSVRRRVSEKAPAWIRLRTRLDDDEIINITGWRIKSNDGEIVIPQAVNFYSMVAPNTIGNIVLGDGNTVYLYLGHSRELPENLRLNTCTGYLNERYEPVPSLPEKCPKPDRDSYKHLSADCQNYIRSLDRCELPDSAQTNSFKGKGDEGNECRAFVNKIFNAGYCYRHYQDDSDFLKNEWQAWISRNILDSDHDWIRLFNRDGKLIDDYVY